MFRMLVSMLFWAFVSCVVLNAAGYVLDVAWVSQRWYNGGYFRYELRWLADFPYWLLATLLLLAANGVAIIRLARFRVNLFRRAGEAGGEIPLPPFILLGINLVLVVFFALAYVALVAWGR
jgi:hypothetical protein